MTTRRRFIAWAAACLALAGCERPPAASAPNSDSTGPRLVVLSPAMAVVLRDLGRQGMVVGRHGFDMVLPAEIPVAGSQTGLDYEVLLRVKPTHVLLEAGRSDLPPRLVELAAREGWMVRTLPMLSLDDVRGAVHVLDEITGDSTELSEPARRLMTSFDAALASHDVAAAALGRVLPLAWTDPVGVMGPGSFHAQMLAAIGATPLPATGAPYITWSVEDVVRADPDSIVLFLPGASDGPVERALGPLAGVGLRAVRTGRVIVITDPLCQTPSTALAGVAEQIVRQAAEWR